MKELLTVFGLALLPALGNFSGGLNRIYRYLFAAQVIAITGAGLSTGPYPAGLCFGRGNAGEVLGTALALKMIV